MANFFTSSLIDEYKKSKLLLEADDDNFDLKDDDEDNTNEEPNDEPADNEPVAADNNAENFDIEDDNTEEDTDGGEDTEPTSEEPQNTEDNTDTTEPDAEDTEGEEENFDIEDDTQEEPQDNEDAQSGEEEPTTDTDDNADNNDAGGDDDNFDLPDDGEGDQDNIDGGEEDANNTDDSLDSGDSSETVDPHQKLKDLEKDIFDNLSADQKETKLKELKSLYISLYGNCDTLLEHIDDLPKEETTIKIYEFISNNINDLKQYIVDYINDTFDNRTYIENLTVFQKYLSVLDTINGLLEEIRDTKKDE